MGKNQPWYWRYSLVQFSLSVLSNSLWPHGLQHARPPCPSPTPGVYSNTCLLSWWCHPTISSSVVPFSSCLQFFPALGSFQMSQLFTSDGQGIGVSASASVLPMNIQDGLAGSPSSLRNSQESSPTPQFKSINSSTLSFIVQLSYPYMTTGKTIALTRWTFVGKVMSLLFNMLCRMVIAFLPRSKCLLISWSQSPSLVILKPRKIVSHYFHCFPIYLAWNDGTGCHDLSFLNVEVLANFFTLIFRFHQEAL